MIELAPIALSVIETKLSAGSSCYRPPSWPPPLDWVVSENVKGEPLSKWGDDLWNFSALAGRHFTLFFSSTRNGINTLHLGDKNTQLLKLFITAWIWGPYGPRSWNHLRNKFNLIRRIFAHCEHRGILASELSMHSTIISEIADLVPSAAARNSILMIFDRMGQRRVELGFLILDDRGVTLLNKAFRSKHDEECEQTAYIPPRIWLYQLTRLRECLDDFLSRESGIAACYDFCVDAYADVYGSLEVAIASIGKKQKPPPFSQSRNPRSSLRRYGNFEAAADRFGILDLLRKWTLRHDRKLNISSFQLYLNLIASAALAYIANFTLQRRDEVAALRADCLIWEDVPVIGKSPIICGETTKTESDSDARWPASPSVEIAVQAASALARLRLKCAVASPWANCTEKDLNNPRLIHRGYEPWSQRSEIPYSYQASICQYSLFLNRFPRLFDVETLKITEDDLTKSRLFTPNLNKNGAFRVGAVWPLGMHQLRRTGAINMFASGLMSDSSIQLLMKHMTRFQSSYYGLNYSRLRFNAEFEGVCLTAKYEVLARQIEELVDAKYVSPLGPNRKSELVINLLRTSDFSKLVKAGEKGEVSFRRTRLGGCAKVGHCEYGGVESTSRCAGGDGSAPCKDALFDISMRQSVERQLANVEQRTKDTDIKSRRYQSLVLEAQALRSYLNAINRIC